MKYLRNPEIQKLMLVELCLTVSFLVAAYWLDCVLLVLVVCLAFMAVILAATVQRYHRMEQLAASIDELLHGNQRVSFAEYREGEMAVLENELSKMTNRLLEQAEQLQQDKKYLSDAMADISHQLRSPLTSSQLILSLLKDADMQDHSEWFEMSFSEGLPQEAEQHLNEQQRRRQLLIELDQLLSHMGWLIESMLKMSKMDAGTAYMKAEPVSVQELLQKSLESVLIPMELRGIRYVQEGVTEEACFTGDLAWCSEALLNVVKNCMEHTKEGGCISVSCEDTPLYLKLVIEDDGEGFAPEDLPHIFERFYRGKNAGGQSVGIGLALARMIIAQMNGSIKAENRVQGGARFTIMFYRQQTV